VNDLIVAVDNAESDKPTHDDRRDDHVPIQIEYDLNKLNDGDEKGHSMISGLPFADAA